MNEWFYEFFFKPSLKIKSIFSIELFTSEIFVEIFVMYLNVDNLQMILSARIFSCLFDVFIFSNFCWYFFLIKFTSNNIKESSWLFMVKDSNNIFLSRNLLKYYYFFHLTKRNEIINPQQLQREEENLYFALEQINLHFKLKTL